MEQFWSLEKVQPFILAALEHYTRAPGWFTGWLEDLSLRFQENWRSITLDELGTLAFLYDEGWMPDAFAVNTVYKLFDRLGRDTTGLADH